MSPAEALLWPHSNVPLGPRMVQWVQETRSRPSQQKDWLGACTGAEGNGKSNLLAGVLTLLDPTFDESRICYSGSEFIAMARVLQPGQARLLDEADEGAFSRDAMKGENKELAKHLFRCRELGLFNGMATPNLRWLDPVISEHRMQDWFLKDKRTEALVHRPRRADYPGAKTSYKQEFRMPVPFMDFPWWQPYREVKKERILGQAGPVAHLHVEAGWPDLDPLAIDALCLRLNAVKA